MSCYERNNHMDSRGSGILLHISSIPSRFGIGDMGPASYAFADFLQASGQSYWQVLPVNPVETVYGNSPYSSISSFAGNPLFISFERMIEDGLLEKADLGETPHFRADRVDFQRVNEYKRMVLEKAAVRFENVARNHDGFNRFIASNAGWLDDFARFLVLKKTFNGAMWGDWPAEYRDRRPEVLQRTDHEFARELEHIKFLQYVFFSQWAALRKYCNDRGIRLFGDVPIYMNYDSPDVWGSPDIFKLDPDKKPYAISGVPPDYFSTTGQLWGNPVYDWDALQGSGFEFWVNRIAHNMFLFDTVRIDHFRGLVAYWEVATGETTAVNGHWETVPYAEFFNTLRSKFTNLPIIAEDLGCDMEPVRVIMNRYGFPGMKVLLFAFGGDCWENPYAPHNHIPQSVIYTGTHDNNTVRGWFEMDASPEEKENFFRYLGRTVTVDAIACEFVTMAMRSVCNLAVIPIQDVLGLGEEARMNRPGIASGNWAWRLAPHALTGEVIHKLRALVEETGRAAPVQAGKV